MIIRPNNHYPADSVLASLKSALVCFLGLSQTMNSMMARKTMTKRMTASWRSDIKVTFHSVIGRLIIDSFCPG